MVNSVCSFLHCHIVSCNNKELYFSFWCTVKYNYFLTTQIINVLRGVWLTTVVSQLHNALVWKWNLKFVSHWKLTVSFFQIQFMWPNVPYLHSSTFLSFSSLKCASQMFNHKAPLYNENMQFESQFLLP
jgi:hypothetical protein